MSDIEIIIGIVFMLAVFLVAYLPKDKFKLRFKTPNLSFSISKSKKSKEEKLKEIDKKLEEVLSEDFGKEKIVRLDEATEEAAKKFEVKGDLLSEMQTTNLNMSSGNSEQLKQPELSLPEVGNLEELGEVEKEVTLEQNGEKTEKKVETKVEFDESDKLLEDIAKEVEQKKEEQLDLLRDLKGQKFSVEELEMELKEVLERAKRLKA
ncbi:MAG: hypothetical protein QXU31_06440 [Archaeoglobaceae archaeon]